MPGRTKRDDGTPPEDIMTADLEGVDEEGNPYGLLKWGQAGAYNAVDDRVVITALSDSQTGIVRPARITAGAGLTINISGGWMAIASCYDGTSAVVSSNQAHQLQVPAGVPAADTQYVIWIETNPNEATWTMLLLPRGTERTRPGVSLGIIGVPPNANLASQFRYGFESPPAIGRHADATVKTVTGTTWTACSPLFGLWTDTPLRRSHSQHVLRAFGEGQYGAVPQVPVWRLVPQDQAHTLGIHTGNGNRWIGARERFSWEAEGIFQLDSAGVIIRAKLAVTLSWKPSHRTIYPTQTIHAVISDAGRSATHTSMHMYMQFRFAGNSAGQSMTCYGSTFENYQPYTD
jgi:hypothetical protein